MIYVSLSTIPSRINTINKSIDSLMNQSLKPDGVFLASLFGENTLIELKESFKIAENEILGKTFNRISPFIDIKTSGDLLQRTGFKLCVSDLDRIEIKYDNPMDLLYELRSMGETNTLL